MASGNKQGDFISNLGRIYGLYTAGFIGFTLLLAVLEQLGVPNTIIGYLFVFLTIGVYALIGYISRTAQLSQYYVAGRQVPAFYNGMATGSDWMSAASFISMAGGLYLQGFNGLAFVLGWTGGYVLVATLLAPYLRKFGQYTVPDFLGVQGWDGMAALYHVIDETAGKVTPENFIAAMKTWRYNSPRGPMMVDPETRDVVNNQYVRRVEKRDGALANVEFDTIPMVKDPWKAGEKNIKD